MRKKNDVEYGSIIVGICGVVLVVATAWYVVKNLTDENVYLQCCNNTPCSNTYYTTEDNKCHVSLEYTYEGANKTMNMTARELYAMAKVR
jgi:hypothetical protein